ncbi:transcriptional regulator with XRE-family HTH domain [Sedimentibacter acidaminivorans]|uniref:Transcriptional regulator with XRE-family HTH domain n=1 Tax=Sedimentibacter acidaminivorans TaxID=913099 RepID=A0ABS4GAC6_9FIRM|nr:helix-turn-helix transcriptional regulator [Sedimentibacter acidaminivorans]MBP1924637.1 transcriptional regulator with XRE-family HTH domain [Sedimentibacter acidaminivorans]
MDNIFGDRLKKLRADKRLLQKQVAQDLNITVQRYSSYENNSRLPEIKMLVKIAKYYNVSLDYLLGLENRTYLDKLSLQDQIKELKNEFNNRMNKLEEYINDTK